MLATFTFILTQNTISTHKSINISTKLPLTSPPLVATSSLGVIKLVQLLLNHLDQWARVSNKWGTFCAARCTRLKHYKMSLVSCILELKRLLYAHFPAKLCLPVLLSKLWTRMTCDTRDETKHISNNQSLAVCKQVKHALWCEKGCWGKFLII